MQRNTGGPYQEYVLHRESDPVCSTLRVFSASLGASAVIRLLMRPSDEGSRSPRRLLLFRLEQPGIQREAYQLGAVCQAELLHDARAVGIDGLW